MKRLVILGAGTAGTMMANKLRKALSLDEWTMTIVDQHKTHYYQPGFLFIPFNIYNRNDVVKPKTDFIPPGVESVFSEIDRIELSDEGFLTDRGQWTEEVAKVLAEEEGIELTKKHLEVLNYLRKDIITVGQLYEMCGGDGTQIIFT